MTVRKKKRLPAGVVEKNGRWYVRVRFKETASGKRSAVWRPCAKNATDAKEVRAALQLELKERGTESMGHARMTWLELSKHFRTHYLVPAKFVDDRLVSGYRSIKPVICVLNMLDAYFGNKPIRTITRGDLRTLKQVRLDTPVVREVWQRNEEGKRLLDKPKVRRETQRSISSVNKDLRQARHLFNIAVDEGWLVKTPFKRNDRLISAADEKQCVRTLTLAEEEALLSCCVTKRRHLRPRIICAIDSGMRWTEMTRMRVCDVDFASGIITVKSRHTKTLTKRKIMMTPRVMAELRPLCAGKEATERILEFDSVKTAWTGLRLAAGVKVRWHDLRHTNATRIEKSRRVSQGQLQRHLGHADPRSTAIYVNQDDEVVTEIASVLSAATELREKREGAAPIN
jgi:integrase